MERQHLKNRGEDKGKLSKTRQILVGGVNPFEKY